MYTAWTKHIKDPEQKELFENKVQSAKEVLKVIQSLIEEEERTLDRSELDTKQFDSPNWGFLQAYKNGYRSGLSWMNKLIDLDHQKGTTNDRQST